MISEVHDQIFRKNDQTWVDVMTADDLHNGTSLNLVLLTFEDDYHLRWKKISASYYKAWYLW